MKALILAGGYATRLMPVTKHIPKPLLPVNGKPIINHIIEEVDKLDSVDEIIISTNKKFENHFNFWKRGIKTNKPLDIVVELSLIHI